MTTLFVALRALVYMTGFLLLFAWVALSMRAFDPHLGVRLPAWTTPVGGLSMSLGAALALTCAAYFIVRGRGTPAVFDPPIQFVAIGPYRYVRNPMFVGGQMLLVGFGLYERSASILLLAITLFVVMHLFVVYYEEPNLRSRFGATYESYCAAVHRWIPHLRAHR